jgi:hypothetical protein
VDGLQRAWLQEMTSSGGRKIQEEISRCGMMLLQQVMIWLMLLKEQRGGKERVVHSGLQRMGLQTAQKRQRQPLQRPPPQRWRHERAQLMQIPAAERHNS